ncbi:MAG: ABC transporter ATP-binding protein [Chloroflexota bacterium]
MNALQASAVEPTATGRDGVAALELRNVHTFYGHIHALKGVSLKVMPGEIVTLIGANGAGKTTTLRTISGINPPRDGEVLLNGARIDRVPAHRLVEMGICQSPEGRRIFSRMTVQENLEMGAFARKDTSEIPADLERTLALFPRLRERLKQRGGTLSGGEQQMLAMGRALMARPRILLLDEPSMGLAPMLVETIFNTIVEINKQGVAVLLVEQNALMALNIAHRGYVLETGEIVLEDDARKLQQNEAVQKAYLGIE